MSCIVRTLALGIRLTELTLTQSQNADTNLNPKKYDACLFRLTTKLRDMIHNCYAI